MEIVAVLGLNFHLQIHVGASKKICTDPLFPTLFQSRVSFTVYDIYVQYINYQI